MTQKVKYYKGDLVKYEIYKLVDFYDPILREPTIPFSFEQTEQFFKAEYIAFSLAETLNTMQGLGLSANQVGLKERVCAVNMGEQIWVMFNPEIIESNSVPAEYAEGCLSYPGMYLYIPRYEKIKVEYLDELGQTKNGIFEGITAQVFQHELDHMNGIVYTEHIGPLAYKMARDKQVKLLKKIKKLHS